MILLSHTIFYALAQVYRREFSRRLLAFKPVSIRFECVVPVIRSKDVLANAIDYSKPVFCPFPSG